MFSSPRARRSAAERREEAIEIAFRHFALSGYQGASTEQIAREAGISQPYLFRLFTTKRELFLACCLAGWTRLRDAFSEGARRADGGLDGMGRAYMELLGDEHLLRFHLQMYAACSDPEIRRQVRDGYKLLVDHVRELTGAGEPELWTFFAQGMMLTVMASLALDEAARDDPWAARWSDPAALLAGA